MSGPFLIDTNVASEFAKPKPEQRVTLWVESQEDLHVSVITMGELRKGFFLLPASKRRTHLERWFDHILLPMFAGRVLPVNQPIADRWGILSAQRKLMGAPLAMADGLIAATALHHNLTVVTRNTKDFAGLGVPLLNPWEAT